MCKCYEICGPFIAEDPDCEVHGRSGHIEQIETLSARLAGVEQELAALKAVAGKIAERYVKEIDFVHEHMLNYNDEFNAEVRELSRLCGEG